MKKWLSEHPYLFTSIIFFVIMIVGWRVLYWPNDYFTYLLLLYFIVTLGIRLDDISRKIGRGMDNPSPGSGEKETLISQLNDIRGSLQEVNNTLNKLLEETRKKRE